MPDARNIASHGRVGKPSGMSIASQGRLILFRLRDIVEEIIDGFNATLAYPDGYHATLETPDGFHASLSTPDESHAKLGTPAKSGATLKTPDGHHAYLRGVDGEEYDPHS